MLQKKQYCGDEAHSEEKQSLYLDPNGGQFGHLIHRSLVEPPANFSENMASAYNRRRVRSIPLMHAHDRVLALRTYIPRFLAIVRATVLSVLV